jgi:hypothetical protein
MRKLWVLTISVMLGVSLFLAHAGSVMAGEGTMAKGEACPLDWSAARPSQFSGFIGALALDRDKNELGRVVDVTVGPDGTANFLIIYSCLPGMSNQIVAYPVRAFDPTQRMDSVVINATKEEFQGAPTISTQMYSSRQGNHLYQESYNYFEKTF